MSTSPYLKTTFVLVTIALSSWTSADEYHHNNLLVGKNAIGLGGAFVAVADDLSTLYYNPAGLVQVTDNNMASINTFAWEETEFEGVFGNGENLERSAFSVVPGFFGFKTQLEDWHLGGALMITDYNRERSSTLVEYQSINPVFSLPSLNTEFATIDIDNSAYQLQIAGARKLDDNWAMGLALTLEYRTFQTDQSSGVQAVTRLPDGSAINTGASAVARFSDDNITLLPSISWLYNNDAFSFGGRLVKPISVSRDHEFVASTFIAGVDPTIPGINPALLNKEEACCKQEFPLNIHLGSAYEFDSFSVSFDVSYYFKVDDAIERLDNFPVPITKQFSSTTNYALGLKYQINESTNLRMGIFTDNANGKIDTDIPFQRIEVVDLIGFSIGLDATIFDLPTTFGLYIKGGDGDVRVSDTRAVEAATGVLLYPPNGNNDVFGMKKRSAVFFFSLNF